MTSVFTITFVPLAGLLFLINPDVFIDPVASKKLNKKVA
jgi:hypothetical protein